jgi:hypothetical protein
MKKFIICSLLAAQCSLLALPAARAANSTADLSSGPARASKEEIKVEKQGSGVRRVKSGADLYYGVKDRQGGNLYKEYSGCGEEGCAQSQRSVRAETSRQASERKYNLSNPFYQPLKGQFASATDLGYVSNGLDFKILDDSWGQSSIYDWRNQTGKYTFDSIQVIENLSIGITDDVSLVLGGRYSSSDLKFHWDQGHPGYQDDTQSTNKLDMLGAGILWRFANTSSWIANIGGYYQKMLDVASIITGNMKIGYKNDDTTVYGFGQAMMVSWDSDGGYGFGLTNQHDQGVYFSQKDSGKSSTYFDVGAGIFTAINNDWSADLSLAYSSAEWHSQVAGTAVLSYQPWQNAALSLFGRIALWDDAEGFESPVWFKNDNTTAYVRVGTAKYGKYSDVSGGMRLTLAF